MASGVWTKNLIGLRNVGLAGCYYNGLTTVIGTNGNPLTNSNGGKGTMSMSPLTPYATGYHNTGSYFGAPNALVFGTGTATPTADDYNVTTPTDNNFQILNYYAEEPTYDTANGTVMRTIRATVQYVGTGSVTITEWGIFGGAFVGSVNEYMGLVYHALLDTSVTLAQDEIATMDLSLSITLAHPQ